MTEVTAALIRECREELAVTVSVGEVIMDVVYEYPDLLVHLTLFNAAIVKGTPQKLEHNDIRWITVDEIPNAPIQRSVAELPHPGGKRALHRLHSGAPVLRVGDSGLRRGDHQQGDVLPAFSR